MHTLQQLLDQQLAISRQIEVLRQESKHQAIQAIRDGGLKDEVQHARKLNNSIRRLTASSG